MNPLRSGSAILLLTLASTCLLAQKPHKLIEVGHAGIQSPEFSQPIQLTFEAVSSHREFTRIRFRSANSTYIINSAYSLRRLNTPGDKEADIPDFNIPNLSFDKSRYFRIGHYQDANGPHTLLFFMGEGYASDPCSALVVGFDVKGHPYKVLEKETFEVTAFLPPVDGKSPRIVGKPTLSEVLSNVRDDSTSRPYATTYDPFAVYIVPAAPAKAIYSLEESRLYNQQHYVWRGSHSSETTLVYYNVPNHQKPFAAPAANLDKIIK
jgi:hypothetical protein